MLLPCGCHGASASSRYPSQHDWKRTWADNVTACVRPGGGNQIPDYIGDTWCIPGALWASYGDHLCLDMVLLSLVLEDGAIAVTQTAPPPACVETYMGIWRHCMGAPCLFKPG